MFILDKN